MECDICLLEWDSAIRIPRLLSCGHTFCEECLKSIVSKAKSLNKNFSCPTCHTEQALTSEEDIKNIQKTLDLLDDDDDVQDVYTNWEEADEE